MLVLTLPCSTLWYIQMCVGLSAHQQLHALLTVSLLRCTLACFHDTLTAWLLLLRMIEIILMCRSMCDICLVHAGVCKAALGVSQKAVFEDRRC